MELVYAAAFTAAGLILFFVVLIGSRSPKASKWVSDGLVANLYAPLMVGLSLLGICYFISMLLHLGTQAPGVWEILISAAIALATFIFVKALKVKQRLERYAAQEASQKQTAEVIPLQVTTIEPETPPARGRAAA